MFTRVSRTYGSTFISLLFLSYFTQGLRCFPLLAITYHFKDYLKVKNKAAKSPPLCCFLLVVFKYIANQERKQIFACWRSYLTMSPPGRSLVYNRQRPSHDSLLSFFCKMVQLLGIYNQLQKFDREALIMFHGLLCCHSSDQLSDILVCSSVKFLGLLINEMDFFSNEFLCFEHVRFLCGFRV